MNPLFSPDFLRTRRSASIKNMSAPGPSADILHDILVLGARVPDHGKLNPWYIQIFEGDARAKFGQALKTRWAETHPDATAEQLAHEENRFLRAPIVIAVISRIREAKIPIWEQILSAGALCYNLCLAANAHGFGANWVTEWYAYDDKIREALECDLHHDHIAGFIYIGTEGEKQAERDRPDLSQIVSKWPAPPAKGDIYNKSGFGQPEAGFKY